MVRIDKDCFSISQICRSGQCFRLEKEENGLLCGEGREEYSLVAGRRYLRILTDGEAVFFDCSEAEYSEFWKDYFDLDSPYEEYISRIDSADPYLLRAAGHGRGIRILRQDTWEMIITFILSQQNNIPRIKKLIHALSERYGERLTLPSGLTYYSFPTPESLSVATEEELRELKLGYRSKYICQTAGMVSRGEVDLDSIRKMDYPQARQALMRLSGIGGKVADCICLFSLHQMDAFPVDTHISKVLEIWYPEGFPFHRYEGCAGLMQQYIFYYDLTGTSREM